VKILINPSVIGSALTSPVIKADISPAPDAGPVNFLMLPAPVDLNTDIRA